MAFAVFQRECWREEGTEAHTQRAAAALVGVGGREGGERGREGREEGGRRSVGKQG